MSFIEPLQCELITHDPGTRKAIRSDNERNYLISLGPHQPVLAKFPSDGKSKFYSGWYREFPFLEYSVAKDAAFCFVCYLFPSTLSSENAWYTTGVRNWAKMKSAGSHKLGKLPSHFSSDAHKKALIDYGHYLHGSRHIEVLLDKKVRSEMIEAERKKAFNNAVIEMLLDIARTLCRQGLAFRGDKDENGNFRQLVELMARHNRVMKEWLESSATRSYHVTYLSAESQNEFISLLGMDIRQKIIEEINKAPFYSLMADTTPDASRKDQMSIIIRYVDDSGSVQERLLRMMLAENKSGYDLAKNIYDTLIEYQIDPSKLCFQSYDFAANMSGQFKGAHKMLSDLVGHIVPYIPCQAHRMNTAVEHAAAASLVVSELFNILEELFVFFTSSTKRLKHLEPKMNEIENALSLKGLSKTRWTARAESIKAVETSFEVVVQTLEEIIDDDLFDKKTKSMALNLYKKILNFDFIVSLFFMKSILYKVKIVTEILEKEEINVIDAIETIDSCVTSLERIRTSEEEVNNLLDAAIIFSKKLNIDVQGNFKVHHRRRRVPKKYDISNENEATLNIHKFYRKEFFAVLDSLISSLKNNVKVFINEITPFYKLFKFPLSRENLSLKEIEAAVNLHPPNSRKYIDIHALQTELEVLFSVCQEKYPSQITMTDINNECLQRKEILPKAYQLCSLISTAGCCVASNERSFSALKIIKNYLRTRMNQERLDAEMLLYFEKEISGKLNIKNVAQKWATLKQRRIKL